MADVREPYPEAEARDYSGQATHILTCAWCAHQAGFRALEPFGFVRAVGMARKAGWHPLPIREGERQQFLCSDVCAAYHPLFRG